MLTFPEVLTLEGVTVFPDDEDGDLYYLVPDRPRLAVRDGKPVMSALFWTDQADGSASVAGLKGGSIKFDVDLAVSDDLKDAVAKQIVQDRIQYTRRAQILAAEQERADRQAKALGDSASPHVAEPPPVGPVRFGTVQYTDGTLNLLDESGGNAFVAWSTTGGRPSLTGDNNAAFAMRLGPEGAAVWYRALEQDLAAIGVRFELTFQARLPSLEIHVWAASHQDYELDRTVERTTRNLDQGCSDADVESIDVKSVTEKLVEEGLINVEIIKGTAKISDDVVAQLRNAALTLIQDRVKEVIQHRIHGLTEEERKNSLIGMVREEVTMFAELRLQQQDVIEWKVNPQGTITQFLAALSADERKAMLKVIDLADPVVSTLEVEITCDAPWTGPPAVGRVIVDVSYPASPIEAQRTGTFSFSSTDLAPKTFRARRGPGNGEVSYTARVYLTGAEEPVELSTVRALGAIHVSVPLLGAFKVKLRPNPDLFTLRGSGKITSLEVDYSYKEEGAPDYFRDQYALQPTEVAGVEVGHTTFRRIDAPLIVKATYHRDEPPAIEGAPQRVWIGPGQVPVVELPVPYPDRLRLTASVAAGLPGLQKVVVDIDYEDADTGFGASGQILLDGDGAWTGAASIVQQRKEQQAFRYRYALYGAEQLARSPWIDASGDQDLLLPLLAVTVHCDRLGIGTKYDRAIVRLAYEDAAHGVKVAQELYVTDAKDRYFLVPRVDGALDGYHYELTVFPLGADPVDVPSRDARGTHLVLQAPA
ncbi:MAG TPA: hypothetical protein VHE35_27025 [Kofleriaceae bacterium]|nr:hypothetical protein [Kofleriaceae bacterium]